jgi:hypothetical protein
MNSWQNPAIAIVLLVTGLILIAGDSMGVLSLDRIQGFWPIALIAVGAIDLPAGKKQRN